MYTCADEAGGSGLASCTGTVDGVPVADGGSLPTGGLGTHALTVVATDHAGNTATATTGYTVLADYGTLGGRLAPAPAVSAGSKAGSTVPVQIDLGADHGDGILAADSPTVTPVDCTTGEPTGPAVAPRHPSGLRHDPGSTWYVYTWKTGKAMAGTCQRLDLAFSSTAGPYTGGQLAYLIRFDK